MTILKAKGFLFPTKDLPESVADNLQNRKNLRPLKKVPSDKSAKVGKKRKKIAKEEDDSEEEVRNRDGYRREAGLLNYFSQDAYGGKALAFETYGLLVPPCNEVEYLFEEKVGMTPFSFIATGVYGGHDNIKGGANIPFVLRSYSGDDSKYIKKPEDFDEYKALFKGTGLTEDTLQWLAKNVQEYSVFFFSYFW